MVAGGWSIPDDADRGGGRIDAPKWNAIGYPACREVFDPQRCCYRRSRTMPSYASRPMGVRWLEESLITWIHVNVCYALVMNA